MADKLISSVYDIPEWFAKNFPAVTGPFRTVGNAARLPLDVGADMVSSGAHGALGLEESDPFSNTKGRLQEIGGALGDTAKPAEAARGGITNALEALREKMIAAGAKPKMTPSEPMNMGPGSIDTELRAGAPAMAPRPPAAAPRPPRAPVTIENGRTTPSALAPSGPLPAQGTMPPAQRAPMGALEEPPAEAARPSLMAQYREKVAGIPAAKGELSEDEKKQHQLEFFLNMLARGSKGGATFLPSMAQAGLDTSAGVRATREKAQARAERTRDDARQDAFREIGFGDKDEDNKRADRRENTRLKLLQKQVDDGKWKVMDNGKSGTYVLLDVRTGQTKDTGIKVPREDKRPADIKLLEHLRKNPGDIDILAKVKGKGDDGEDKDAYEVFRAAVKRVTGDVMGTTDMDTAVQEARRGLQAARGGQPMLPKGIPPGSKQIGTSGGKPVYQAPDGKRYKVE